MYLVCTSRPAERRKEKWKTREEKTTGKLPGVTIKLFLLFYLIIIDKRMKDLCHVSRSPEVCIKLNWAIIEHYILLSKILRGLSHKLYSYISLLQGFHSSESCKLICGWTYYTHRRNPSRKLICKCLKWRKGAQQLISFVESPETKIPKLRPNTYLVIL